MENNNEEFNEKITDFSLNLYRQVLEKCDQKSNVFFSPTSIAVALAMTYSGSAGTTKGQINQILFSGMNDELIGVNMAHLCKFLNQEFQGKDKEEIERVKLAYVLSMANRLYCEKSFQILPTFQEILQKNYMAEIVSADIAQNPNKAKTDINQWVSNKTNEKIPNLLDDLDSEVKLIIVNAIYFKGSWEEPFDPSKTATKPFYMNEHETKNLETMQFEEMKKFKYGAHEDCNILKMRYGESDLCMAFILPNKKNGLQNLEKQLNGRKLLQLIKETQTAKVKVQIPKFRLETTIDLVNSLQSMGISELFSDQANLSKIDGHGTLKVDEAIHKAFIEVNEKGAEAAAATAFKFVPYCLVIYQEYEFIADHPFLFAIVEEKTNTILFLGRFCG